MVIGAPSPKRAPESTRPRPCTIHLRDCSRVSKMRMRATLVVLFFLGGCSLFGPPLQPPTPSAETLAFEAAPKETRAAFVNCARQYGAAHGGRRGRDGRAGR